MQLVGITEFLAQRNAELSFEDLREVLSRVTPLLSDQQLQAQIDDVQANVLTILRRRFRNVLAIDVEFSFCHILLSTIKTAGFHNSRFIQTQDYRAHHDRPKYQLRHILLVIYQSAQALIVRSTINVLGNADRQAPVQPEAEPLRDDVERPDDWEERFEPDNVQNIGQQFMNAVQRQAQISNDQRQQLVLQLYQLLTQTTQRWQQDPVAQVFESVLRGLDELARSYDVHLRLNRNQRYGVQILPFVPRRDGWPLMHYNHAVWLYHLQMPLQVGNGGQLNFFFGQSRGIIINRICEYVGKTLPQRRRSLIKSLHQWTDRYFYHMQHGLELVNPALEVVNNLLQVLGRNRNARFVRDLVRYHGLLTGQREALLAGQRLEVEVRIDGVTIIPRNPQPRGQ